PVAPFVPRRGVEEVLETYGLRYFFVDRHLLSGGRPLGVYADRFEALRHVVREDGVPAPGAEHPPYRAYRVGVSENVACFGRDPESALQVWSGEHGYPGAPPARTSNGIRRAKALRCPRAHGATAAGTTCGSTTRPVGPGDRCTQPKPASSRSRPRRRAPPRTRCSSA